jgi:molecular chaperone DnaK
VKTIGIDLGTTNSLVAVVEGGVPRVLPVDGRPLLPSVVGYAPDEGLLVGYPARNQYRLRPEATVRSVKRHMGDPDWRVVLGGTTYDAPGISALILGRLKQAAEEALGAVGPAVITVPAYFGDRERQATIEAGRRAGLEVVRVLNEPTAAALAYSLLRPGDRRVLVYDLGGGTFDASLVEIGEGVTEVLASHGNRRLGGDDFDERLVAWLLRHLREETGVDLQDHVEAMARLYRAAEDAKIALSTQGQVEVREEFLSERDGRLVHLRVVLTRQEFESLIEDLVDRTLRSVEKVLADARLTPADVDEVILVGGSSRIPLVQQRVAETMGKAPHHELSPEEVVALGAAVQGAILAGEGLDAILVDVTAHALGVEVYDPERDEHVFEPILRANTPLPAAASQVLYTVFPDQTSARIRVFEGDSRDPEDNTLLGEFTFDGLAPAKRRGENRSVLVEFRYDVNGVLEITATDRNSGKAVEATFAAKGDGAAPSGLSEEGRALYRRLQELLRQGALQGDDRRQADALLAQAKGLAGPDGEAWAERAADFLMRVDPEY